MLEKMFKFKENNTNVKTEVNCRSYHIYDNGLHPGS